MARKRSYKRKTKRRSYRPKVRRVYHRAKSFFKKSWIYALISIPVTSYVLKYLKIVPRGYEVPASIIGAGALLYALDGKKSGETMMIAGVGSAVIPMLMGGMLGKKTVSSSANVWG